MEREKRKGRLVKDGIKQQVICRDKRHLNYLKGNFFYNSFQLEI